MTLENWLPPTAMVALLLFIAREGFDFYKKKMADRRKVKALKAYLAKECELLKWTMKKLYVFADDIKNAGEREVLLAFEERNDGSYRISSVEGEGEHPSCYVIRFVDLDAFEKYFLDIAEIDDDFFVKYQSACTSVAELRHVFDSMLDWERSSEGMDVPSYLVGLSEYAEEEIKDAEKNLTEFYKYCTGKTELPHRLR